jgi:hypothetical protein
VSAVPFVGFKSGSRAATVTSIQSAFGFPDGRIVFAISYERAYTLIGTTDRDFTRDPAAVVATTEEIAYLCNAASFYFAGPVVPADVEFFRRPPAPRRPCPCPRRDDP